MSHQTNSKNIILECALKLFSEKGYDAVGITEITTAAGITKPTLYYFFGSKEGVFKAILEEYYERLNAILKTATVYTPQVEDYEKDINPVLKRIVNAYFTFAKEYREFYVMVLTLEFSPPIGHTTKLAQPFHTIQYDIITNLFIEIGNVHTNLKGKEKQLARHFMALINADIAFWMHHGGEMQEESSLVHQFMHGIFA